MYQLRDYVAQNKLKHANGVSEPKLDLEEDSNKTKFPTSQSNQENPKISAYIKLTVVYDSFYEGLQSVFLAA